MLWRCGRETSRNCNTHSQAWTWHSHSRAWPLQKSGAALVVAATSSAFRLNKRSACVYQVWMCLLCCGRAIVFQTVLVPCVACVKSRFHLPHIHAFCKLQIFLSLVFLFHCDQGRVHAARTAEPHPRYAAHKQLSEPQRKETQGCIDRLNVPWA